MDRRLPAKVNPFSGPLYGLESFTIGTEDTNTIKVSVQLKSDRGTSLGQKVTVDWYLSDYSDGRNVATTAPTAGVVTGTNGIVHPQVTGKSGLAISDSSGRIDFVVGDSGTPTFYLVLRRPDGTITVSGAITFA
jgi:hypothetical protein